jgi:predicted RNA-binding Zn-ribbon protein involved in translation (DUF1610 family)
MAQTCYSCATSLPERGTHCPQCGIQTRCKTCRELLEPQAGACVECGARVESPGAYNAPTTYPLDGRSANTLELREEVSRGKRSRTLRVACTDDAVESLSPTIGMLLGTPFAEQPKRRERDTVVIDGYALPLPSGEQPESRHAAAPSSRFVTDTVDGGDQELIKHVFLRDGERLLLIEPRLKATSQRNAVQRLTHLYLYARQLEGHGRVPRDELNAALREHGLFDSNASSWISRSDELLKVDDTIGLTNAGLEAARTALREVLLT